MISKTVSEYNDESGRLVCVAKKNIGYGQFASIAQQLTKQFKGNITDKAEDGFSQRYWDISIDNVKVCFHFDDMIHDFEIISLEGTKSDALARKLVRAFT